MLRGLCASLRVARAACLVCPLLLCAQETVPASRFTDSVGVNVHLASQDSAYGDSLRVRTAIKQLGVKHVRDGLLNSNVEDYYTGLTLLARDGVHALLYTDVSETSPMLRAFPTRAPGSLEGIEAPNELDATSESWLKEVREAQQQITKATSGTQIFTVAPALTRRGSFAEFGTQPCDCMFGNLHNYFGGRHPGTAGRDEAGTGSYPWTLQLAQSAFGSLPLMTTESGYVADPSVANGVPEDVAGKYTVRLLLEQFLHGIRRTYLYELIDMEVPDRGIRDHDGLLRADFTPRPAFTAVSALLKLLQETNSTVLSEAEAAAQDVLPAAWKLEGGDTSLHHLALRKSNGETILLLWQEVSGYDPETRKVTPVAPQSVVLHVQGSAVPAVLHFASNGALKPVAAGRGNLMIDDAPTVVLLPAAQRVLPAPARRIRSHGK
ncbi:hypothetical protein Terro_1703 [Terriglobus roseus DSM 18391]|uniref:Glycosyl hydrolase catalytic core n=1 Tax=Terriglobus roseus (strain DSM 18391 / NRRL B-41598 / KBS 63) TaxID=926566 RepID=I3ZFI7_TERRK|nr:hypothetical protein [Terriglobus roseus]AFL88005.1 hypothetical protein Terro_1703 [Terriglobus roseus DSM 18391]